MCVRECAAAELPDVRTSCGIAACKRRPAGSSPAITLVTETGEELGYDAVVFATHSDTTLRILGQDATPAEREVLSAIPYNDNDIYLHTGVHTAGGSGQLLAWACAFVSNCTCW
jgi:predicted NAD/FAD-binding protein